MFDDQFNPRSSFGRNSPSDHKVAAWALANGVPMTLAVGQPSARKPRRGDLPDVYPEQVSVHADRRGYGSLWALVLSLLEAVRPRRHPDSIAAGGFAGAIGDGRSKR